MSVSKVEMDPLEMSAQEFGYQDFRGRVERTHREISWREKLPNGGSTVHSHEFEDGECLTCARTLHRLEALQAAGKAGGGRAHH